MYKTIISLLASKLVISFEDLLADFRETFAWLCTCLENIFKGFSIFVLSINISFQSLQMFVKS